MSFEISLEVNRPTPEVFAFVADFGTMPRWYEAVRQITASTPPPLGVGSRFHMVRALPGGPAHNDVEVTSFQQDSEVTFASVSGPTPFRYQYRFASTQGGTRLILTGDISAEGLPGIAGHLGAFAGGFFKRGMRKNLMALKRVLEG
jgi:hypothetical protein